MSVCRYYLRGVCRFGDRCRFKHVDNAPDYSNRTSDYGYQEKYQQHNYDEESYNQYKYTAADKYSPQQRYNYQDRYETTQQQRYSYQDIYQPTQQQRYNYPERHHPSQLHTAEQNLQHYENRNNQYYNNTSYGSQRYSHPGYSEYESYASNQYQNKPQRNQNERVYNDYRNNEHKTSKGSSTTYNTSTPKSKVAFSFKDPGISLKKDQSSDLHMNQPNIFCADVMKKDVEEWEKGNIWLFSCYTPIVDKPCFPGFFDLSPEELRVEAYKAKENNTYSTFVESVKKAVLEVKRKRAELTEPSIKLMSDIEKHRTGETFDANTGIDVADFFSKLSNNSAIEEMVADESQVPQKSSASSFSFKTSLETDNPVQMSASSFSFKLPPETHSKSTVPLGISDIYTPLEELEFQDKEQFLASTFSLGKIPTVPPPKALCF